MLHIWQISFLWTFPSPPSLHVFGPLHILFFDFIIFISKQRVTVAMFSHFKWTDTCITSWFIVDPAILKPWSSMQCNKFLDCLTIESFSLKLKQYHSFVTAWWKTLSLSPTYFFVSFWAANRRTQFFMSTKLTRLLFVCPKLKYNIFLNC